ncbi:hypothetical protein TNCV_407021 [Trichonephila clavipes]|nr:hypothetical protein TNCV_407021 [Trichonephila clavipes]
MGTSPVLNRLQWHWGRESMEGAECDICVPTHLTRKCCDQGSFALLRESISLMISLGLQCNVPFVFTSIFPRNVSKEREEPPQIVEYLKMWNKFMCLFWDTQRPALKHAVVLGMSTLCCELYFHPYKMLGQQRVLSMEQKTPSCSCRGPLDSINIERASYDFWLFPKMNRLLEGSNFESRDEIKQNAFGKLNTIPKEASQKYFRQWKEC